jgi:hypothetical protein
LLDLRWDCRIPNLGILLNGRGHQSDHRAGSMQTRPEPLSPSGKACGALLGQAGSIVLAVINRDHYYVDMRIVMTGDRSWVCRALSLTILRRLITRYGNDITRPRWQSRSRRICCQGLPRAWHQTRNAAIRLVRRLRRSNRHKCLLNGGADLCVVLHRSLVTSDRTKDVARRALAAGIPTFLIESDRAYPMRFQAGDWRLV